MSKKERQQKLLQLIRAKRLENQHQLLEELRLLGVETNQATISRDLNELGIVKLQGLYHLPQIGHGESRSVDILEAVPVGDNLIIVRTLSAQANSVAIQIDQLKSPNVAGTIAGDDTIFVAVFGADEQKRALKQILEHFRRH